MWIEGAGEKKKQISENRAFSVNTAHTEDFTA